MGCRKASRRLQRITVPLAAQGAAQIAARAGHSIIKAMTLLDWDEDALAEGLRCYCNREFFAAHEHWESVWLRSDEPEKTFLQALIQIAAAFHHLQRGNRIGAASLLRAAYRRLQPYPAAFAALNVEAIRTSVRAWLAALEAGDSAPGLPFPAIR